MNATVDASVAVHISELSRIHEYKYTYGRHKMSFTVMTAEAVHFRGYP